MEMQRIAIVGSTGSGKSTLAHKIAQALDMPAVELDALHWEPNWTPTSDELLSERVAQAVAGERWVIEGGYSRVRPLIWSRADTVIWLDYPLAVNLRRLIRRTTRRIVFRETLWGGNKESLQRTFSRDSIIVWLLKTYQGNRAKFTRVTAAPEYSHLTVHHFRTPRQTEIWLRELSQKSPR